MLAVSDEIEALRVVEMRLVEQHDKESKYGEAEADILEQVGVLDRAATIRELDVVVRDWHELAGYRAVFSHRPNGFEDYNALYTKYLEVGKLRRSLDDAKTAYATDRVTDELLEFHQAACMLVWNYCGGRGMDVSFASIRQHFGEVGSLIKLLFVAAWENRNSKEEIGDGSLGIRDSRVPTIVMLKTALDNLREVVIIDFICGIFHTSRTTAKGDEKITVKNLCAIYRMEVQIFDELTFLVFFPLFHIMQAPRIVVMGRQPELWATDKLALAEAPKKWKEIPHISNAFGGGPTSVSSLECWSNIIQEGVLLEHPDAEFPLPADSREARDLHYDIFERCRAKHVEVHSEIMSAAVSAGWLERWGGRGRRQWRVLGSPCMRAWLVLTCARHAARRPFVPVNCRIL